MNILYQDKYLLLCEKEAGENSQFSNNEAIKNLPERLSEHLRASGEADYIGLVHRLDVTTGGVILYSRMPSMTGKLSELVQNKEYEKTYLCVVHGIPEQRDGELCDLLFHDKQKNKTYVVSRERRGVKTASLTYEVMESVTLPSGESASLLRVKLITGRTHQIRVQFASRKMPLFGDGKYGSKENGCTCALWSHRGDFCHPVSRKRITVESFPPDTYPWNLFNISLKTQ